MPWSTPSPAPRRSWIPAPWLAAAASIALTVVVWGAAMAAPCPSSVVHFEKYELAGTFYVSALTYDSTFTPYPYEAVHILFDRTQATTSLIASTTGRMAASSRVVEAFDVVGVPPGTLVNGTLEFRLDGWSEQNCGGSGCGVRLEGWLASGTDSTAADANQFGPNYGRRFVATTLALPVTFVAGSPIEAQFFLTFGNGPGGGAQVEIQGRYAVSGLPAGVQAVACQDVTPTRRDTWGRLKSSYR